MIKPDGLWNFFKSAPDIETVGRVCFALAGRDSEIGEQLNKYELGYMREIINSDEWHEDASQRIADRKRRDYLQKKATLSDEESGELDILTSRLSVKPSLAKKAKMAKVENMENVDIRMYPSIHPSVHPSIRPSNKNKEGGKGCRGGVLSTAFVTEEKIDQTVARLNSTTTLNITPEEVVGFKEYVAIRNSNPDADPRSFVTQENFQKTLKAWIDIERDKNKSKKKVVDEEEDRKKKEAYFQRLLMKESIDD